MEQRSNISWAHWLDEPSDFYSRRSRRIDVSDKKAWASMSFERWGLNFCKAVLKKTGVGVGAELETKTLNWELFFKTWEESSEIFQGFRSQHGHCRSCSERSLKFPVANWAPGRWLMEPPVSFVSGPGSLLTVPKILLSLFKVDWSVCWESDLWSLWKMLAFLLVKV